MILQGTECSYVIMHKHDSFKANGSVSHQ